MRSRFSEEQIIGILRDQEAFPGSHRVPSRNVGRFGSRFAGPAAASARQKNPQVRKCSVPSLERRVSVLGLQGLG